MAALADPGWCARVIATHGERVAVSIDVHVVMPTRGSGAPSAWMSAARGGPAGWRPVQDFELLDIARLRSLRGHRRGAGRHDAGPDVELYRAVT